jgi:serine/threonine-protein kinase
MEAGQVIAGKYRLNRIIGSGGMASVWSATNVFTERQFAIKVLLPQVGRTAEAKKRFLLEAKVSARINHPNIIEIIDVGQSEDGSLFLVMELLTGQSLETAIRRQRPPMPVYDFAVFMLDVARALAAAHKSGVVHRDLKPTNIFLHRDRDGNPVAKILDFGVSKILEDEQNTALTVAGTVLGSPLYMSPEQAMGAPGIDGRTDIFAFGSIMFEALAGTRAFDAPNFNALIVTIATKQPKKIDDVATAMPECLRSIVRDCMTVDRNKRIQSFDLIVPRLEKAISELEKNPLRLPSPEGAAAPSDPDATNALPVMRPSDRPPGFPSSRKLEVPNGGPRSEQPQGFSATPPGATTAVTRRRWPVLLFAIGGVALLAAVVFVVLSMRTTTTTRPASAASSVPVMSAPLPSAAPTSSEPPVIPIDKLPVASAKKTAAIGQLAVSANPGYCTVTVDGMRQGPTPIARLDLSAGEHKLECTSPAGRTRATSITIQEGQTTRYRFMLDD